MFRGEEKDIVGYYWTQLGFGTLGLLRVGQFWGSTETWLRLSILARTMGMAFPVLYIKF